MASPPDCPPDGTLKRGTDKNIFTCMMKAQRESPQEKPILEDDATLEVNTIIAASPQKQPIATSGLVTFLRGVMDGTHSIKTPSGGQEMKCALLKILVILIEKEELRQKQQDMLIKQQELSIKQLQQITERVNKIEKINSQDKSHEKITQQSQKQPHAASYASIATTPGNSSAEITPPSKTELRSLRSGCSIIHSKPNTLPFNNQQAGLIVQRTNEGNNNLNANVNGNPIAIQGARVLLSGDVRFYTKNRNQSQWLIKNKHTWSKEINEDLEATPILTSVRVNGIPKTVGMQN
ncbi:hypothetical protein O181_042695 [Austropuccinia psidii MF-1]|uniref:Uncharacterized protein n=1 Tax=Austropuccinia psidii MF-1 TaxID=1389203 RepID=A0A9Q3DH40_9BASI|nr:hypothetical protein [Austropuccinia psidii MF-1]